MLLALKALQQSSAAPVVNLRVINPYVSAALADWQQRGGNAATITRQLALGVLLKVR